MPEHKHTPGPWIAFTEDAFSDWWAIKDETGKEIGSGDGGFEKEDAYLIAAAPDLLEALEYVLETHFCTGNDGEDAAEKARAAIAKATGQA